MSDKIIGQNIMRATLVAWNATQLMETSLQLHKNLVHTSNIVGLVASKKIGDRGGISIRFILQSRWKLTLVAKGKCEKKMQIPPDPSILCMKKNLFSSLKKLPVASCTTTMAPKHHVSFSVLARRIARTIRLMSNILRIVVYLPSLSASVSPTQGPQ